MVTKFVGILNVTPDSFSDGGKFNSITSALKQLEKLILSGADIIDIGAQSTRPNAQVISQEEEWKRLKIILPACIDFAKNLDAKIEFSIDTFNVETAKKSYDLGVKIINDVSGLKDQKMIEFLAKNKIKTVLMHSLSVPADPKNIVDENLDVVLEIMNWAKNKIDFLLKNGFEKSQIIFDVGIGFGKNAKQSIEILRRIDEFRKLDLPLYIGHSRKSFLQELNFQELQKFDFDFSNYKDFDSFNRDEKTAVVTKYLLAKNIDFIRTHQI